MHGTFRTLDWPAGYQVCTSVDDVEALVATFPDCPPFRHAPSRARPLGKILTFAPCLLVCAIGPHQVEPSSPDARQFVARIELPLSIEIASPADISTRNSVAKSMAGADVSTSSPQGAQPVIEPSKPESFGRRMALDHDAKHPAPSQLHIPSSNIQEFNPRSHVNQGHRTSLRVVMGAVHSGKLEFSDKGQVISIRLGSLLSLVANRFDKSEFERLSQSAAASEFVPMDTLVEMGMPIRYDPVYDEFCLREHSRDQEQEPSEYW